MNMYRLLKNWPQLPAGFILGNPTGIGVDSHQHIVVFHRAGRAWRQELAVPTDFIQAKTILVLNRSSGKIINSWGENLFILPHGLTVDAQDNIWVTDVLLHQVFKFSYTGELLMKLGEAFVAGNDKIRFNCPTDIAVAKDGSFYVSDGYGNSRVVKFSAGGEYLFEWGSKGNKEGEFDLPHAIELDNTENVYVADRNNCRIQVFNAGGQFLQQWTNKTFEKINSVAFNKYSDHFFSVDFNIFGLVPEHYVSRIIELNAAGIVIEKSGNYTEQVGVGSWYHNIIVDNEENLYVSDIAKNKIYKFIKQAAKRSPKPTTGGPDIPVVYD